MMGDFIGSRYRGGCSRLRLGLRVHDVAAPGCWDRRRPSATVIPLDDNPLAGEWGSDILTGHDSSFSSHWTVMETQTIGQYLIDRLHELGVRHVFGIPGDYVLAFYKLIEESPLELVGNTNELARGLRRRRLRPGQGHRLRLRHLRRRRPEPGQRRRPAPTPRSRRSWSSAARPGLRSGSRTCSCTTRSRGLRHAARGLREAHRRLTASLDDPLTAFREIDRVLAPCCATSGRSTSSCRATASTAAAASAP